MLVPVRGIARAISSRFFSPSLLGICLLLAGARLRAAPEPVPTHPFTITGLDQVWVIDPADRAAPLPIDAECDIAYYDPEWKLLWTFADSGASYIPLGPKPLSIASGQHVRIEGTYVAQEGLSADRVKITVLPDRRSHPVAALGDKLSDIAAHNAQLVSFRALVNAVEEVGPHHLRLTVSNGQFAATAVVQISDADPIPSLDEAIVDITGLCITTTDPAGHLVRVDVWIPSLQQIKVQGFAGTDPLFNLPRSHIDSLREAKATEPVHIAGRVHAQDPGHTLTLRDDTGQIVVLTAQTQPVRPGDFVEAVGYPQINGTQWTLSEAHYRVAHEGEKERDANAEHLPRLRLADLVISLAPEEAARGYPVSLAGVVTWSSPGASFFFIADSSGAVRVDFDPTKIAAPNVQDDVRITGTSVLGTYAPEVRANVMRQVGTTGLPSPSRISLEQALTGVEENRWVELEGYVRRMVPEGARTNLDVLTSGGDFVAVVNGSAPTKIVGSVVTLRGVCAAVSDAQRQLVGIRLWVPSLEYIQTQEAAPADPFSIAPRSIASLRRFSTLQQINRRVHVVGTVIHITPGQNVSIQDDSATLSVFLSDATNVALGDRVDVVGFPSRNNAEIVLREARIRRIAAGSEPEPDHLEQPSQLRPELDGRLVQVDATIVQTLMREREFRVTVEADNTVFEAALTGFALPSSAQIVSPGAFVRVTGVYDLQLDKSSRPRAFQIKLRTLHDIQQLRAPRWWTAEHALIVVGVVTGAMFLGFGWVVALRRRVRRQTQQLRDQWEKEARLQARHQEIVENASDFIYSVDADGVFTSFNAAGEQLTGYSRDEAMEMKLSDLITTEETKEIDDASGESAQPFAVQGKLHTADGRTIWVETSSRAIYENGVRVGELGIVRNISKRKQIEEELKRTRDAAEATTRSKSAFLANMSHEIRTPMNGVIGMSNLLLDTKLTPDQRDFAETIRNSAEALLTVLNDILDFSKIEAGKLRFESVDFDLRETIESTMELLAPRAAAKHLELTAFVPIALPCRVRGDPGRLRQVLLNILGNAIKFTEHGEISLSVNATHQSEHEIKFHFEISDTGIGLSEDAMERLFTPFTQADDSTNRRFGGTGLGLAISKQILQLMEGEIGVRSVVAKGSTFWFTAAFARQPRGGTNPPHDHIASLKGRRVLIIDDNSTNRRILQHYLAAWGMAVEEAVGGDEAMQRLIAAHESGADHQLVLCDYQMPGRDGLEVCRAIHADPRLNRCVMLLLTALDNRITGTELGVCGISEMLTKPIRQHELLNAILRSLKLTASASVSADGDRHADGTPPARMSDAGLRILVAEDNVVNQRVTTLQLRKLGHKPDIASDGLEVLEALERADYDVVLMDCQMPEMDGYEATRRIRGHGRHAKLKIVAMTANAMKGDREACLAAGMDDYVSKPVRPEDLAAVLKRVKGGRGAN